MERTILYFLSAFAIFSCNKDQFQPISFFEVSTGGFEDLLDTVSLSATLRNDGSETDLEYGFLYSLTDSDPTFENLSDVIQLSANFTASSNRKSTPPPLPSNQVERNQLYFYRAYAKLEGRTVYGEVRNFIAGDNLLVRINEEVEINNTVAKLRGFVIGLFETYRKNALAHGHIYAELSENQNPILQDVGTNASRTNKGELLGEKDFISTIEGLRSNTEYIAKSYIIIDDNTTIYSDPITFEIGDTWQLHSTLDRGIREAIAVVSNNGKVYLGIGCPEFCDLQLAIKDIYEFDPKIMKQERIAPFDNNFTLGGRIGAIAFNIRDTIYIGGGLLSNNGFLFNLNDLSYFFPENSPSNRWSLINSYPQLLRSDAVVFVIDNKAYYGLGESAIDGSELNDFYEFDPSKISSPEGPWTRLADLDIAIDGNCSNIISRGRKEAVAFALNGKGYVLTGLEETSSSFLNDVWEFDPNTKAWTCDPKKKFLGGIRGGASSFVIGNKAYVIGGIQYNNQYYTDVWSFDGEEWKEETSFPGKARKEAVAFSINGKGYLATGQQTQLNPDFSVQLDVYSDIWEYTPEEN